MLRFRVLGVPTEIHPGFWILPIYLGLQDVSSVAGVLLWIGIVLASILIHELGHAATVRAFGESPRIGLHMLGGTTSWRPTVVMPRQRQILVSLAGPGAGFGLGIVALVLVMAIATAGQNVHGVDQGQLGLFETLGLLATHQEVSLAKGLALLVWVNFFWGFVNLMPVLPFDGGQVLAAALGPDRRKLSARVSFACGTIVALLLLSAGSLLGAVLFFTGGLSSLIQAERGAAAAPRPGALDEALSKARAALDAGQLTQAAAIARAVYEASDDDAIRGRSVEVMAWAAVMDGDFQSARVAVDRAPVEIDALLRATLLEGEKRPDEALEVITKARATGDDRLDLAGLQVRLLLEAGRFEKAARATRDLVDLVPEEEARLVASQALEGGASYAAALLLMDLFQREEKPEDAYDAARGFARAAHPDAALEALDAAVRAGHPDPGRARSDGDLESIRSDERFEAALGGALPGRS